MAAPIVVGDGQEGLRRRWGIIFGWLSAATNCVKIIWYYFKEYELFQE
jgi:hypothetical protein